jgi:hypothetical protein
MRNKFARSLVRTLAVALIAGGVMSSAMAELNLTDRRAVTAYEQGTYAKFLKDIQAAAGFAVPVEVKWESIALPEQSANYSDDDFWTRVFFIPLQKALAATAADDMGKQALKAKLQKIVIYFDQATAPSKNYAEGVTFKDGVLSINFAPYTNPDDIEDRVKGIQKVLEAGL